MTRVRAAGGYGRTVGGQKRERKKEQKESDAKVNDPHRETPSIEVLNIYLVLNCSQPNTPGNFRKATRRKSLFIWGISFEHPHYGPNR